MAATTAGREMRGPSSTARARPPPPVPSPPPYDPERSLFFARPPSWGIEVPFFPPPVEAQPDHSRWSPVATARLVPGTLPDEDLLRRASVRLTGGLCRRRSPCWPEAPSRPPLPQTAPPSR